MRRLVMLVVVLVAAVGVVVVARRPRPDQREMPMPPGGVTAQATPALPRDAPLPDECRVAPRSLASLRALVGTPVASGAPAPTPTPVAAETAETAGTPADPATVAQVVAVEREVTACFNAGDFARAFALYGDALAGQILAGAAARLGLRPEFVAAAIATPHPVAADRWRALRAVGAVEALADGRVRAVVVTDDPDRTPPVVPDRVVFVRRDGRWLVEQIVPLGGGTPPP